MIKYICSPLYKLIPSEAVHDLADKEIQQIKKGESFLWYNIETGRKLSVNATIHAFLMCFERLVLPEEAFEMFAEQMETSIEEVVPIAKRFFDDMVRRDVLVSQDVAVILKEDFSEEGELKPLEMGLRLGAYKVEKRLASQVPTEIYVGEDVRCHESVILKVLRAPEDIYPNVLKGWRKDFAYEFDILKDLEGHPNIVRVLEMGELGVLTYGALEKVSGESLLQRLEVAVPSLSERMGWLMDILDAFAWMHLRRIVHGDVHARNVLITEQGQIKVIDFDLALRLDDKAPEKRMTGGIPEYIAPEKLDSRAFEKVKTTPDCRSEVYQLGVLAYFIFYEKMPYVGLTWKALAKSIQEDAPIFPNKIANGENMPSELIDWIAIALQKDPNVRYESARTMYSELREAIDIKVPV
jgi:eukaryotic-like serine/threonine-protein kinase